MRSWVEPVLLAALFGLAAGLPLPGRGAVAQAPISLSIDADPEAAGIQSSREVAPGSSFTVAVVADGIPDDRPLGAFQFDLVYDDTVVRAPEVADDGRGLDDNPDADQDALGSQGWDCSVFGAAFPQADRDTDSGPEHGQAFIGCLNVSGPFQAAGTVTLATVRFDVVASTGQSELSLEEVVLGDLGGVELASCAPATLTEAPCESISVTISGAVLSPTDGMTEAGPETTPAGPEETPAGLEATPTPPEAAPTAAEPLPSSSDDGSGGPWPWPGFGWVLAGLAAVAVVGGAAFYFRGRLVRP